MPAELSARVRVLDAGQGRKTDATDAHAVVIAALRGRSQRRELSLAEDLVVLRLLADRREDVAELLHIHVQQRPGMVVFVAADRFPGGLVEVGEPVEPAADQHRVHRRGRHPEPGADLDRAQPRCGCRQQLHTTPGGPHHIKIIHTVSSHNQRPRGSTTSVSRPLSDPGLEAAPHRGRRPATAAKYD